MRRRRDERGAVFLMVAVMVPLLLVVSAFAVDLGMQRVLRRDLQALADVVALDLARELDGRPRSELMAESDSLHADSSLSRSVARNPSPIGHDVKVTAEWGAWDGTTFDSAADPPTAVRVTATGVVDFAFVGGSGGATRTAIGTSASTACFRLGSFAAAVRTGDASLADPLNDMFGGLDLQLVSYQGLANADISLAQLAARPQIGSADALLTGSVSFANLVHATIDALDAESPTANAVAVDVLETVATEVVTSGSVRVGEYLNVSPSDTAALQVQMSVLDLVTGAVLVANGVHTVSADHIQAQVPGLGNVQTSNLHVQEGLQQGCGEVNSDEATAYAAQLEGTVSFVMNASSVKVDTAVGNETFQTSLLDGSLTVSVADTVGRLVDPPAVHCGSPAADPHTFTVEVTSGAAHVNLTFDVTLTGKVDLGLGLGQQSIVMEAEIAASNAVLDQAPVAAPLSMPPHDTTPYSIGSDVLASGTNLDATVTRLTVGGLEVAVTSSVWSPTVSAVELALLTGPQSIYAKNVVPLITSINNEVIRPISDLLGLRLGGADVFALGAACSVPALRG